MPTLPVSQITLDRAKADPEFRLALLSEAMECLADNDVAGAKKMLRDYILASTGFEGLAKLVGKRPESLMRMFSATGNPKLDNLAAVICALKEQGGFKLEVHAVR